MMAGIAGVRWPRSSPRFWSNTVLKPAGGAALDSLFVAVAKVFSERTSVLARWIILERHHDLRAGAACGQIMNR